DHPPPSGGSPFRRRHGVLPRQLGHGRDTTCPVNSDRDWKEPFPSHRQHPIFGYRRWCQA
ncbi:MAG: hypothetical protein ACREX8_03560, partial [Gammaproteobacteria bacterium]